MAVEEAEKTFESLNDAGPYGPESAGAVFDDIPETDDKAGKDRMSSGLPRLSGTECGTLYHYVMTFLSRDESAEEMLVRIAKQGLISAVEKDTINDEKIEHFRASALAQRFFSALDAGKGFRERKFIVGFPVKEILVNRFADVPDDARVMVQGIVDMYFEEADGLVIVDYKTDRVRHAEELKGRYAPQLMLYAKALEQITHKKVKETWIYSFSLDEAILLEKS